MLGCQTCWYGTEALGTMLNTTSIRQQIESSLVVICEGFLRESTCVGFWNVFADMIVQNLLKLNLRPDYMCTEVLDMCPSYDSDYVELNETDWVSSIMGDKPASLQGDDFVDRLYEEIRNDKSDRAVLKFVHFTDIHMDPNYTVGASKDCKDLTCCHVKDGFPTDPSKQAPPLGTFGCDIPMDVVHLMGEIIN